ncbi:malectin isoform X1 [Triplophysa rosa]|uniref:malectin isoform X1 n=1 Tax=Triplophysa rosa TaxID=992332 RepID=UPI0025463574|nr:malectin isoform X1 [Triplophysa rosa]
MRRVTVRCVWRIVFAALWLLVEECRTESAAPSLAERVIWAVNAGGDAHTDVHGIHFKKDPLEGKLGKASDYGVRLPILRSSPEDQILYQTERYNEDTFGYEVPIREEGDYILVLKFSEVYFAQSQQKVFDVRVNGHVVVKDLDIFDRVGHSTAHDEIVPLSVKRGKLSVHGEVSTFNGKLAVEFVKGYYDNPKICALYVMKGKLEGKREPEDFLGCTFRRAETAATSRSGKARGRRGRRGGGGRRRRRKEDHLNLFQESRSVRAPNPQPVRHRQQQPNVSYTGGIRGLHTHPLLPLPPVRGKQVNERERGERADIRLWRGGKGRTAMGQAVTQTDVTTGRKAKGELGTYRNAGV